MVLDCFAPRTPRSAAARLHAGRRRRGVPGLGGDCRRRRGHRPRPDRAGFSSSTRCSTGFGVDDGTGGRAGRVLVVGGGIAGLATARALHRHGIECDRRRAGEGLDTSPAQGCTCRPTPSGPSTTLGTASTSCGNADARSRGSVSWTTAVACCSTRTSLGSGGRIAPCLAVGRRELHEVLCEGINVRHATTGRGPPRGRSPRRRRLRRWLERGLRRRRRCRRRPLVGADHGLGRRRPRLPGAGELALPRRRLPGDLDVDGVAGARQRLPGDSPRRRAPLLLRRPRRGRTGRPGPAVTRRRSPRLFGRFAEPVPEMLAVGLAARRPVYFSPTRGGRPGAVGARTGRRWSETQRTRCHRTWPKERDGARGRARPGGDDRLRPLARGVRGQTATTRRVRAGPDATSGPHARSATRRPERISPDHGSEDVPRWIRTAAGGAMTIAASDRGCGGDERAPARCVRRTFLWSNPVEQPHARR